MIFVIDEHAKKRLVERLGVSERKIYKVVQKAWGSEFVDKRTNGRERSVSFDPETDVIRSLMGYLFVFKVIGESIILKTVIRPKEVNLVQRRGKAA